MPRRSASHSAKRSSKRSAKRSVKRSAKPRALSAYQLHMQAYLQKHMKKGLSAEVRKDIFAAGVAAWHATKTGKRSAIRSAKRSAKRPAKRLNGGADNNKDVLRSLQATLKVAQTNLAAAKRAAGSNPTAEQESAIADAQRDYDLVKDVLTRDAEAQAEYISLLDEMRAPWLVTK
jgi:hypothetical protein